ncbi:MAG TPA: diacylglycerol kinase family protein [Anaerolineae bacterium]|nr:diacylglycerol kinase family protein [Anaerolineae bacterium]
MNHGSVRLILNPAAGRGAGARLAPAIVECLRDHDLDFQIETTDGPGHATRLAHDATAKGEGVLVAVGGDGTVNEVLNGLMLAQGGPDRMALGVLPIGTGNDFAYGAGVPLDLTEACRVIAQGRTKMIDVGLFHPDNEEPRYFGNGIGMGFDAVANIESRKVKRLRGTLLYLVAVLRTLAFYYHAPQTNIQFDAEELSQPSLMVSVMNGRRMGGGFYMTPTSQIDDGVLDLCVAAKVSRSKMVRFVPRFMRGTHITDRDITMGQGRKVTVTSESPWAAQIDGEIYGVGARHFEVELFPQRLCLAC